VTTLAFLSPAEAGAGVALASPLHGLALGGVIEDVSYLGKLEVRGELARVPLEAGEELIPVGPSRGLLVTEAAPAARARVTGAGLRCYDLSAAFAGLEVEGEALLRRLTELDLERLPAVGAIARGVPAVVQRREGERFRLFVPQELGLYVGEVILDLARGLRR
jgi:hypothetical protein